MRRGPQVQFVFCQLLCHILKQTLLGQICQGEGSIEEEGRRRRDRETFARYTSVCNEQAQSERATVPPSNFGVGLRREVRGRGRASIAGSQAGGQPCAGQRGGLTGLDYHGVGLHAQSTSHRRADERTESLMLVTSPEGAVLLLSLGHA
jgi:hypothetical protein